MNDETQGFTSGENKIFYFLEWEPTAILDDTSVTALRCPIAPRWSIIVVDRVDPRHEESIEYLFFPTAKEGLCFSRVFCMYVLFFITSYLQNR